MNHVLVYVIVVTFNGERWVEQCMGSLAALGEEVNVIVVDNKSADGTVQAIRQLFPKVTLIALQENVGFGKANNIGIQKAMENNADFVFLLNQDAWIFPDTISQLVKTSQLYPEYGIVSPVHLNGSSTGLDYNFSLQASPEKCKGFYSDLYLQKTKDIYKIAFVNAAAWLLTSKCLKTVGLFEPLFFLYGEDDNYVQRAAFHELPIGITPNATICHDRAIREGKKNHTGIKTENLTISLILLLDITRPFSSCVLSFFAFNIKQAFKGILNLDFYGFVAALQRVAFFFGKYSQIKESRKLNKAPGNAVNVLVQ